jgi:hypothetical protein
VGIRLITADKKVYSFGYQMPFEEQNIVLSNLHATYLTTAETRIRMLDYEEFRKHEGRMVTSMPASSKGAKDILDRLNALNQKQLRFVFIRQNCTSLVQEVMQLLDYDVNIRATGGAILLDMLPYLNQFPLIGGLVAQVEACAKRVWEAVPKCIAEPLKWVRAVVVYLPEKFGTFMVNLLVLKLGGAKKTTPLIGDEEELSDRKGIQHFSSVIRSWTDMFKDETSAVNHSKFFVDWQKQQKSTFIEPKGKLPKLAIVPPEEI